MQRRFLLFIFIALLPWVVNAQISAPGSAGSDKTYYPVSPQIDSIFAFCAAGESETIARLRVNTQLQGTKTFSWDKYNPATGSFEFYLSESSDAAFHEITNLENGGYRATVTLGAETEVFLAWVFNNWITVSAELPDSSSNCDYFKLVGSFTTSEMKYYDPANNAEIMVDKNTRVNWKDGDNIIATFLTPQVFNPPTKDTEYTLRVFDKFGCEGTTTVTYYSIVTKALFTASPMNGEAPLTVNFTNTSENGDPARFEWHFFRDLDEIKRESESTGGPVDSIMIIAFDQSPVFTYEYTGTYNVKLISRKVSEDHTCVDTVYIDDYIVVDSSFVDVPNVFTPNGDGTNDNFVVKFWSMETIEISIFNRWGRRIHYWESGNVRGFEGTWTETVWDGRLAGGRFASPGVYYYNVVGEGRDGKRRRAHGFFHLFRGKD